MDIFTHAAAILMVLYVAGHPLLIPFGVLGAVIIDIDMAWFFIAREPSLYLLHHAGFSHSFFGATVLSAIAFVTTFVLSSAGWLPGTIPAGVLLPAFAATLAGAYLHLFLDWLAAPGLPLLYPLTEKRFGLAMTPMPLYFLVTLLSLASLGVIFLAGELTIGLAEWYLGIFAGILIVSAGMKWVVHRNVTGRSYYTLHPFQWIVIREENPSYTVVVYDMFRGVIREQRFEKFEGITHEEARRYDSPELRRHRYYSYVTTVEKVGSEIRFRDPVREEGLITYPPWYPAVTVNIAGGTGPVRYS